MTAHFVIHSQVLTWTFVFLHYRRTCATKAAFFKANQGLVPDRSTDGIGGIMAVLVSSSPKPKKGGDDDREPSDQSAALPDDEGSAALVPDAGLEADESSV